MKKMFQKKLAKIIIIGMFFSLIANLYLQIEMMQKDMETESEALFGQVNQILRENRRETQDVTKEFQDMCLLRAKAAAYIIQNNPSALKSQKEIEKIAELLEVDELHIFNKKGTIFAGSVPKYFGYCFESGAQMRFFLPMLEDKTLELCQPITPNTAEGKLMQYAAVWREDGEGIIQIGMEPKRVIEATKKNELSYIFSLFTEDKGTDLYAVEPQSFEILGSTNQELVGKKLADIGIEDKVFVSGEKFHEKVNGELSYCIFSKQSNVLIARIRTTDSLYQELGVSTFLVTMYLLVISFVMIYHISKYLDKKIVLGIYDVNKKLQNITNGNLEEQVEVSTTPEFAELSGHINKMVKSLLDMQKKIEIERDEDHLTGLYNRRAFYAQIKAVFSQPHSLQHTVFIAIDTDNLKFVNDNYGHDAGDCYLRKMADILRSVTAPKRIYARLSGDEFAILIYGCESREELQYYVEELRNKQGTENVNFCNKLNLSVEFSMGCAYYKEDGEAYQELLKCADDRMYEEKRRRKQDMR